MFARHNRLMGVIFLFADVLLALASFGLAHEIRSHLASVRPLYPLSNYPWIIPLTVVIVGRRRGGGRNLPRGPRGGFAPRFRGSPQGRPRLHHPPLRRNFRPEFGIHQPPALGNLRVDGFPADDDVPTGGWRFAAPLRRSVAGFRHFLLVGDGPEVAEIARTLEANETRGMRLFGFVRIRDWPPRRLLLTASPGHIPWFPSRNSRSCCAARSSTK